MQSPTPAVLRPKDAAAYLGIGLSTLWRWAQHGTITRPFKISDRVTAWRVADLDAFLAARQTTTEVEAHHG